MPKLNWTILLLFGLLASPLAAADDIRITIIYDNNSYNQALETRWGFSCLVEGLEKTILFDTGGEGSVLLNNMDKLKIDPHAVDVIALSHIHQDHIGGLSSFLEKNNNITAYIPESFPQSLKLSLKRSGARMINVHKPLAICKHVYSTGELGGWLKEVSLVIKTARGLVVITGCAHPGIVTIVKKAKEILQDEVLLILGGFHLTGLNKSRVSQIIKELKKEGVKKVAPCHCSGNLARKLFKKAYGKNFILVGTGKQINIEKRGAE